MIDFMMLVQVARERLQVAQLQEGTERERERQRQTESLRWEKIQEKAEQADRETESQRKKGEQSQTGSKKFPWPAM